MTGFPDLDAAAVVACRVAHACAAARRPAPDPYLSRETIDRVVPSNGPNPAATADA